MHFLRLLYFAVYSISLSKNRVDIRFNPAAFIVFIIQPVINSAIGVLVNLFSERRPLISGSDVIYAKYDIWTYVSIGLSAVCSWFLFDRNRRGIFAEFSGLNTKKGALRLIVFGASLYIFLGFYLYTVDYILAMLIFVGWLTVGNIWMKSSKVIGHSRFKTPH